jgi:alpha-N-acetylglucosaminidase
MDPFHEGGSVAGVDLDAAGKAIMQAMKKNNPKAVWVAQAWQANPRSQMIENLKAGDMIVLDLFSESRPQWGDPESTWHRKDGFGQHDWIYCMLLNYGGNVGLHGKMAHVIDEYYKAKESSFGKTLRGVGMTMEGSENNPVMFELLTELPWCPVHFDKNEWLKNYTVARYGKANPTVQEAWILLSNSIYNCPPENTQQGTHESIFCARPSDHPYLVSSWSEMSDYYNPDDVIRAAAMMVSVADQFTGNNNFEYDLVDIVRQAIAEKGRLVEKVVEASFASGDKQLYNTAANRFLQLLLLQDELLGTRPEFKVGNWIARARSLGNTPEEKDQYEWNARVQITTWGNRNAADKGGLRDYAHKEWNGILKDFYYMRWKTWFDYQNELLDGKKPTAIDFYALEEPWTKLTDSYSSEPEGDCISTVKRIFKEVFN